MRYDYTDSSGVAYYECACGTTYNEEQFTEGKCPECARK